MHGYGELYMRSGRYEGEMEENRLRGEAYWVISDGSKYEGTVGQNRQFEPSLLDGNEYANGVFHGAGKLTFADGSVYEASSKTGSHMEKANIHQIRNVSGRPLCRRYFAW